MKSPTRIRARCLAPALAALVAAFAAWLPAGAQADDRTACLDRAASRDLAGKIAFQNGLHDLIVEGKPEFAALAALNRDLQLALAASRAEELAYLLTNDPARIETDGSITEFRNFEWAGADEAALRRGSETYRDLARRIAALRRHSDGHPDWPGMRAYFADVLTHGAAYRELTARLTENEAEVSALLQSCPPP